MSIKGLQPGVRAGEGREEGAESITALGDVMSRWPGAHRWGTSHLQTIPAFIQRPPPGPSGLPGDPRPPCRSHQASQAERTKGLGAELVAFDIDINIPNLANQSGTSQKKEVEAELVQKGSAGAGNRKLLPVSPTKKRQAVGPLNQSGSLGVVRQESDWLAGRSTWTRRNRWIQPCRTHTHVSRFQV